MDQSLKRLIANGMIGASIGAVFSRDKEEGAIIGALLGAVFTATQEANKQAELSNQQIFFVENNKLFIQKPNGDKVFLRDLPASTRHWDQNFKLK